MKRHEDVFERKEEESGEDRDTGCPFLKKREGRQRRHP
jgi:hypothetical protein